MPTSAGAGAAPPHASSFVSRLPLAGRALLHRVSGSWLAEETIIDQVSCHLIILRVSPRRPLTPTAADIS